MYFKNVHMNDEGSFSNYQDMLPCEAKDIIQVFGAYFQSICCTGYWQQISSEVLIHSDTYGVHINIYLVTGFI